MKKIKILNLEVDSELKSFIDKEAIPGTGLSSEDFWSGFDEAVHKLAPVNKKLIEKRDIIQKKIDLGLPLDSTLNIEFENNQKHKNYIFSTGIDLIHEFFNLERKTENDFLSKSIKYFNKNPSINKIFTKIADRGLLF